MRITGKVRTVIVLLALGLLVHSIRETRPKSFSIGSLEFQDGTAGSLSYGTLWLLDKTGSIQVKQFTDNGFYTLAKVSILGEEREFVGLPITGKFYRLGDSKKPSDK